MLREPGPFQVFWQNPKWILGEANGMVHVGYVLAVSTPDPDFQGKRCERLQDMTKFQSQILVFIIPEMKRFQQPLLIAP